MGRTSQRPVGELAQTLECLENPYHGWHLVSQFVVASLCRRNGFQHRWCKDFAKDVGRALLGRRLASPVPWDVGRLRTSSCFWNVPRLIKKEPFAITEAVQLKSFVPAETLKTCALTGLHLMAAEGESGSRGSQAPDSGDMWRHGCSESPDWNSDGERWSEGEGLSSSDFREHYVESLALRVIGLKWSGEKFSLFLEDWELARVASSCHIALDMLCQEMREAW